jgi:hypothetical protein
MCYVFIDATVYSYLNDIGFVERLFTNNNILQLNCRIFSTVHCLQAKEAEFRIDTEFHWIQMFRVISVVLMQ